MPVEDSVHEAIVQELKEAKSLILELTPFKDKAAKMEGLENTNAELLAKVTALEETATANQAKWSQERTMLEHGITDQAGQQIAQLYYGQLAEEGRPELGEWLGGLKAEGAEVPTGLQGFLGGSTPVPTTKPQPATNTGNGGAPPPKGEVDAAAINAAREHLRTTGDRSRLEELLNPKAQ